MSGDLSSVGSDTLSNLMTLWSELFVREYPNVRIQIQSAGSATVPTALTQGTAKLGPMSRRMKQTEVDAFVVRHGYTPLGIRVALDAIAIYVHKDNPLHSLTVPQVDAIFSVTRRCGHASDIDRWIDLGLGASWRNLPIRLFGRNSVSGTHGYFKQVALCAGDFKNRVSEQPGSASVVYSVATSINGIGYSGVGYSTTGVRKVPIALDEEHEPVEIARSSVVDGKYPFTRYLYVYLNKRPGVPLAPVEREFLKLVLSRTGQEAVQKDGYIALSQNMINRELARFQ